MKKMVKSNFENFDFTAFETAKKSCLTKMPQQMHAAAKSQKELDGYHTGGQFILKEFDSKGNLTRQTFHNEQSTTVIEYLDQFFRLQKHYYPDGKIHSKVIGSWLGFEIGTGYFFDNDGKIINKKDNDKGYEFGFDQVLNFCRSKKIKISEELNGPRLTIRKSTDRGTGKTSWSISSPVAEKRQYEIYQLDGSTGKINNHYYRNFPIDPF